MQRRNRFDTDLWGRGSWEESDVVGIEIGGRRGGGICDLPHFALEAIEI
jgi:hypothetical protein